MQAATGTGKPLIYFSGLISPKNFYFFKTNDSKLHLIKSFLPINPSVETTQTTKAKIFKQGMFMNLGMKILSSANTEKLGCFFPQDFLAPKSVHTQGKYAHVVMALKCWQIASG